MDSYNVWLLIVGFACFGAAWLPHLLRRKPISFPMVYVGFGAVVFSVPLGLQPPDPLQHPHATERLTELIVIVSLMGVGLKLDRPVGWNRWTSTWRLLGLTMPLCIAGLALLGWLVLGLSPAAAILLGAVLAPTDPVLAADVQATPPMESRGSEVRFALTSESGLNDGLAFPFTYLALAVAGAEGSGQQWLVQWIWYDLLLQVAVGLGAGLLIGYILAIVIFRVRLGSKLAQTVEGIAAIAITLVSYAATEMLHGYGFLAVFVSALTIRHYERQHEYHRSLHEVAENIERLLMAALLVLFLFGGALASGLLEPLTWQAVLVGLGFLLLIRPLAGMLGLARMSVPLSHRAAIAFFGIRGAGSAYYLAYALNQRDFGQSEFLWATVAFVVLASIVIHGITATPVMNRIEEYPLERQRSVVEEKPSWTDSL